MMELTATDVRKVFDDSLFTDDEIGVAGFDSDKAGAVYSDGITMRFGFHPTRLEAHRQDVSDLLSQLPEPFFVGSGEGWSFLSACQTRDGEHWGEHMNMEQLFALGQALGMVRCLVPRKLWHILPGQMPYYAIDLTGKFEGVVDFAELVGALADQQ